MIIDLPIPEENQVILMISDGTNWASRAADRKYLEENFEGMREALAEMDEMLKEEKP